MNFENVKVVFEDVHFLRATSLVKHQDVLVTISIHRGTGRFEVIEGTSAVVHGFIKQVEEIEMSVIPELNDEGTFMMKGDEFYKAFRMRGFYHSGPFRGLHEIRSDAMKGSVKWLNNWITFLDSITHFDLDGVSKDLALPTKIRKFVIDPHLHYKIIEEQFEVINPETNEKEPPILDANICPMQRIIQVGGVEIHDKMNRVVNKRRQKEPNLDAYKFIPFYSDEKFSLDDAAKVLIQTVLEDIFQPKFSSLEIDDDDHILSESLAKALKKIPMISTNVTLLSKKEDLQFEGVDVSAEEISSFNGMDMIIKKNCLSDSEFLEASKSIIKERGLVISIDEEKLESSHKDFKKVGSISYTHNESIYFISILKHQFASFDTHKIIEITSKVEDWLEPLQNVIKDSPVILYSYNNEPSGILGFINCVRREFATDKIKCVFINDPKAPKFDIENNFYRTQLELDHAVNVFKDGKWGGYRHVELPKKTEMKPQKEHCYAN